MRSTLRAKVMAVCDEKITKKGETVGLSFYAFFANKNELLTAALEFPVSDEMVAKVISDPEHLSPQLMLETLLGLWSVPDVAERLTALLRVAGTHPDAGEAVSGLFDSTVLRALVARVDDGETGEFRAALVATQLAGLALLRLVIPLPAVADASIDDLVAAIAPTIERYLEGDLRPEQ